MTLTGLFQQSNAYLTLLLCMSLFSCVKDNTKEQTSIYFKPSYQNEALGCELEFEHKHNKWRVSNIGFFISNVEYTYTKDAKEASIIDHWEPVSFIENHWQTAHTSLVWFAPSSSQNCDNQSTNSRYYNNKIQLQLEEDSAKQIAKIRFTIGVPFSENHQNPLTQASPLNNPDMFWSWRNGHKFMRIDIQQEAQQEVQQEAASQSAWSFHLGSLGCSSASSLRSPESECLQPNRINVELSLHQNDLSLSEALINFHLDQLLKNLSFEKMPSCMFNIEQEESCQLLLSNLQQQAVFEFSEKSK